MGLKKIYDDMPQGERGVLSPEVVLFADESAYANLFSQSPHLKGITRTRTTMGNTGVPYDSCMVEDADSVIGKYRAAIFPFPISSDAGKRAMALCEKLGVPYLSATTDHYELTVDEIREFYETNGIHFYTEEKDVVYVGNGYVGLHSANGGMKRLRLPRTCTVSSVFGTELPTQTTDCIEFKLEKNATALFSVAL